jgi:signal transduction histidine kinase
MRRTADKTTFRKTAALILYFCLLFAVFLAVELLTATPVPKISTSEAAGAYDFTSKIGMLDRNLFDFYPEKLYSPQDFAAGAAEAPAFTQHSENNEERQKAAFGTSRLVLNLPAGIVYEIASDSATYAQKVWVNGQLLSEIGTVSSSREGFIPRTEFYTACFTADGQPTEIVVQCANFVHWSGTLHEIYLGPQNAVSSMASKNLFRVVFLLAVLITASLLFFGVALFFPDRREFLWFALACFSLAIRDSFVDPKPVMILFPQLNWYLGHKTEHITYILTFFFMLLLYREIFPEMVAKPVRIAGYGLLTACMILYGALPSVIYSRMTQGVIYVLMVYIVLYAAAFLAGILKEARKNRKTSGGRQDCSADSASGSGSRSSRKLMAAGIFILLATTLVDAVLYRRTKDYNFSQIGMMAFIFITATALAIESLDIRRERDEAGAREEALRESNRTLSNLYKMRSDFLSDISHEMRTPLTVMSSYAGLTRMQIEKNAVNENTAVNLNAIQQEAVRLARLVEQIKSEAVDKERKLTPAAQDIGETLKDAADFCRLICEKNRNTIRIVTPPEPLAAVYIRDGILQVLYNLIINGNRHSKNSEILLQAYAEEENAAVTVTDHGTGIDPAILPHIFERGISGDEGTGIGLALCRQIIEDNGGSIEVVRTSAEGTVMKFTLPAV